VTEPAPPLPSETVPQPPAPTPPAPPPAPAPPKGDDELTGLREALEAERRKLRETQQSLAQLQRQGMTEQEKAVAEAEARGKAEGLKSAGLLIAAAEFKALAAGRLADPDEVLSVLDLTRFVRDDGTIDKRGMAAVVEKLVKQLGGAKIPAGPQSDGQVDDFVRQALAQGGRRTGSLGAFG
jgi:hypothetical protein